MKQTLLAVLLFVCVNSFSQSVGVGTNSPAASSVMDISSTSKGLLVPRMTAAQRTAIASPALGV
jgi:hypothetical protein